jgi:hypothetical protein
MKKVIFIVLLFCYTPFGFAQSYFCNKIIHSDTFQNGNNSELKSIAPNGDYAIYGKFNGVINIDGNRLYSNAFISYFYALFNSYDSLISLQLLATANSSSFLALEFDHDYNMVISCYITDSVQIFNNKYLGNHNTIVLKQTTSNQILWQKTILGNYQVSVTNIGIDSFNNIIITGGFGGPKNSLDTTVGFCTIDSETVFTFGLFSFIIIKLTPSGSILWINQGSSQKNLPTQNGASGFGLVIGKDNSIYTFGYYSGKIAFDSIPFNFALNANSCQFIAKYRPTGEAMWVRGVAGPDWPNQVQITNLEVLPNGHVIILGNYHSNKPLFVYGSLPIPPNYPFPNTATTEFSTFIISYDSIGNAVFAHRQHNKLMGTSENAGLAADPTSNKFYTAVNFDGILVEGTDTFTAQSFNDILIEQYDSLGNHLWYKQVKGNQATVGRALIMLPNTDLLAIANSFNQTLSCDTVTQAAPIANTLARIRLTIGPVPPMPVGLAPAPIPSTWVAYPNPASQSIALPQLANQIAAIQLYNTLGQPQQIILNSNTLIVNQLATGIYFVKITTKQGNIYSTKFIKN